MGELCAPPTTVGGAADTNMGAHPLRSTPSDNKLVERSEEYIT